MFYEYYGDNGSEWRIAPDWLDRTGWREYCDRNPWLDTQSDSWRQLVADVSESGGGMIKFTHFEAWACRHKKHARQISRDRSSFICTIRLRFNSGRLTTSATAARNRSSSA
jgi:hypothetical protein